MPPGGFASFESMTPLSRGRDDELHKIIHEMETKLTDSMSKKCSTAEAHESCTECQSVHYDKATATFHLHFRENASPVSVPSWVMRDLCMCSECWNPVSNQRDLPHMLKGPPPMAESVTKLPGELRVTWSDGHLSEYKLPTLRRLLRQEKLPEEKLWDSNLKQQPPAMQYNHLFEPEGVRELATQVLTHGFCVVRGVPLEKTVADDIGHLIGHKRPTSMYGPDFMLTVEPPDSNMNDSSLSDIEILHHTDGCYLQQPPSLQVLLCFDPGRQGTGVSSLIDGFAIADEIRLLSPSAFKVLAERPVEYHFQDDRHQLLAEHQVIQVDAAGKVVCVNWNNYDRAALPSDPEHYEAMQLWDQMVQDEARWHVDFQLQKGEMLIFDNRRLLHARKGRLGENSTRALYSFYLDDKVVGALRFPQPLR
jgi:gamma-butyrobetaine dioxygenase